jgi:hypothetical protein
MEYAVWDHSTLMPAAFTTLPHFSASATDPQETFAGSGCCVALALQVLDCDSALATD